MNVAYHSEQRINALDSRPVGLAHIDDRAPVRPVLLPVYYLLRVLANHVDSWTVLCGVDVTVVREVAFDSIDVSVHELESIQVNSFLK